jgi:hypothetical protein
MTFLGTSNVGLAAARGSAMTVAVCFELSQALTSTSAQRAGARALR